MTNQLTRFIDSLPSKITILGTEWSIIISNEEDEPDLENTFGICAQRDKTITINVSKLSSLEIIKETLRHEILHAMLFESGLGDCSNIPEDGWAVNEEMIDWFAIQFPKISKIYKQLKCI